MEDRPSGARPASAGELKAQLEMERAGVPFVAYRDGAGERQLVALTAEEGELWLGRDDAADLRLGWDAEVSGLHAKIETVGSTSTLVDDGLSTNGTFVNGERVQGRRRLRDGDVVRLGRTELSYGSPGQARSDSTVLSGDALTAAGITPAQRRVLVALCRPYGGGPAFASPATNQQIAEELSLSVDAVKTHLRALFESFGVASLPQSQKRTALVERALTSGLISEREL